MLDDITMVLESVSDLLRREVSEEDGSRWKNHDDATLRATGDSWRVIPNEGERKKITRPDQRRAINPSRLVLLLHLFDFEKTIAPCADRFICQRRGMGMNDAP